MGTSYPVVDGARSHALVRRAGHYAGADRHAASHSLRQYYCDDSAPPALKATVDVECPGGKVWTLSDGSDLGRCRVDRSGGQVTGATCSGAEGKAQVTCTSMGGQGSCVGSGGKGSCTEKK